MTPAAVRTILLSVGIGAAGFAVHMGAVFLMVTYVERFLDMWHVLVAGLVAVPVYSLTPKAGVAIGVALAAALAAAVGLYLGGNEACDGAPCEIPPVLQFPLLAMTYGPPALVGEFAGRYVRPRLWHRGRASGAAGPPASTRPNS